MLSSSRDCRETAASAGRRAGAPRSPSVTRRGFGHRAQDRDRPPDLMSGGRDRVPQLSDLVGDRAQVQRSEAAVCRRVAWTDSVLASGFELAVPAQPVVADRRGELGRYCLQAAARITGPDARSAWAGRVQATIRYGVSAPDLDDAEVRQLETASRSGCRFDGSGRAGPGSG